MMDSRVPGASEPAARTLAPEEQANYDSPADLEKSLDKTLADSFPSSDPPSSIPDPGATPATAFSSEDEQLRGLTANTWAAISVENQRVVGTGVTQEEATEQASAKGFGQIQLVQVPATDRTP
jgi:hypothetical protein